MKEREPTAYQLQQEGIDPSRFSSEDKDPSYFELTGYWFRGWFIVALPVYILQILLFDTSALIAIYYTGVFNFILAGLVLLTSLISSNTAQLAPMLYVDNIAWEDDINDAKSRSKGLSLPIAGGLNGLTIMSIYYFILYFLL